MARIHYERLGCDLGGGGASETAELTDGFSSRELAEQICPSVTQQTGPGRRRKRLQRYARHAPASRTQVEQLKQMREAASSLRRANNPAEGVEQPKAQIGHGWKGVKGEGL